MLESRVRAALGTVYDPELDEPITDLGFVGSVVCGPDGEVGVVLRLPTPQCAPNFAFLMAADARDAVLGVPGVASVAIELEDHYTGAEINAAVASDLSWGDAFPGESSRDDLDALRELFQRKALLARQARVAQWLLARGWDPGELIAMRVCELPDSPDATRVIELRAALGLACAPQEPALVAGDGSALTVDGLARWLARGRLVSLSLEANGGICRDLLRNRYGEEVAAT